MKILTGMLCLLLAGCASQPTVESINASNLARETKCEQEGYKKDTRDFQTCLALAQSNEMNSNMAKTAGITGAAVLVGGLLSDERVKRDIVATGEQNGFQLYRFRYLWSDTEYLGVMAQEVLQSRPEAVTRGNDGYLRVNYELLGIKFQRLN
jgi:hypothetical protein